MLGFFLGLAGALIFVIGLFWTLSSDPELAYGRKTRAVVSIPIIAWGYTVFQSSTAGPGDAFLIVFNYVGSLMAIFIVWRNTFAHLGARLVKALTLGGDRACGSSRPDFRLARSYMDDDDFDNALKCVLEELDKDASNYDDTTSPLGNTSTFSVPSHAVTWVGCMT